MRSLLVAGACLLFAVGFLFGREGSGPSGPSVQALRQPDPLAPFDVNGSAMYMLWSPADRLVTIGKHDLYRGELVPQARFSAPDTVRSGHAVVSSLDGSTALALRGGDRSFVAVVPDQGEPFAWIPGEEAAWEASDSLLIRQKDGSVVRWSADRRSVSQTLDGTWSRVIQTPSGAALLSADHVELHTRGGSRRALDLPEGAKVLAVTGDGTRAVITRRGLALWDGASSLPIASEGFRPLGAMFSPSGDRAAVTLRGGDGRIVVAIVDAEGKAAIKPIGARSPDCSPVPSWDGAGAWVYVAPGDGLVHAVEASGGRTRGVAADVVGCGIAWVR